ncbi:hypothetical protein MSG28_000806 [Choristoneura fumiferana]|uniref:Uncharacterized protein n=1 Tax=Choristoneura fumiferana TaxID=7141 RepID=A0ACC0K272_CHOFU|nr:hypothetical protein MSG28_000806 [Choristoneura fumiferana]
MEKLPIIYLHFAYRRCGASGLWLGRRPGEASALGWTNYTPCFPPEVQTLFVQVYDDERDAQLKFEIAQSTRYMEIAGFSISLVALIVSLIIFSHYRSLRNNRTRIHKSLFSAMVLQVLIRLTVYIDQALVRSWLGDRSTSENVTLRGIDNMGISHVVYYATGWGLPVILTALWAVMTALHYRTERVKTCWYGYNFTSLYWIVQGPRLGVILINLVFLLNIMKALIAKLRRTQSTELEKVRKAVRAALVLLPLLGITNAINMTAAPLDGSVWRFGLWCYGTHFLRSFQGFFIATFTSL